CSVRTQVGVGGLRGAHAAHVPRGRGELHEGRPDRHGQLTGRGRRGTGTTRNGGRPRGPRPGRGARGGGRRERVPGRGVCGGAGGGRDGDHPHHVHHHRGGRAGSAADAARPARRGR